jgi:hemerythrin-like metal-binding protein
MNTSRSTWPQPIVAWTDMLLVGNDAIDADHKYLFTIAGRLHAGILEKRGDSLVRSVLNELTNYARDHFSREEALMAEVRYAWTDAHVFEHRLLTYRLKNLQYQLESGQCNLAEELGVFLDKWLARHILTSDLQFAASIRGIQAFPARGAGTHSQ